MLQSDRVMDSDNFISSLPKWFQGRANPHLTQVSCVPRQSVSYKVPGPDLCIRWEAGNNLIHVWFKCVFFIKVMNEQQTNNFLLAAVTQTVVNNTFVGSYFQMLFITSSLEKEKKEDTCREIDNCLQVG